MADRFFDSAALCAALDAHRQLLGISWRELCRQAGLATPNTMVRLRQGHPPSLDTFLRLLAWLSETDITPYVRVWREAKQ